MGIIARPDSFSSATLNGREIAVMDSWGTDPIAAVPVTDTPMADTIPDGPSTTATLAIGSSVDSRIDTVGDRDWFAVTLAAGQTYAFVMVPNGPGGTEDPYLRLHNAAGTMLLENDDGGPGRGARIVFTPTTSGTYYISAGSWNDNYVGDYRLSAELGNVLPVFTNDQIADQMVNGYWGGPGFARHFNVAPGGTITYNMAGLTAAGQILAREAFVLWSDVTGISFTETAGTANITLDDAQEGAFASSSRIGNTIQSSTVNVGTGWLTTYGTGLNSYSFQTYIHEIGHAIGLGHSGDYNGSADYGTDNTYQNDSWATSVMSYFDQVENTYFQGQGFTRQFVITPGVADIIATTTMYGTASNTRTGNTTYGFNNTSNRLVYDGSFGAATYTVVDHGGVDTLDYSLNTQTQTINLNSEAFSSIGGRFGNVTIARGTIIENAVGGSGNDTIIGNGVANLLDLSRGGNDQAFGNGGDDGFYFGSTFNAGDSVDGGSGADQIALQGANQTITIGAGGTINVEMIVLLPGDDTRYANMGGALMGYSITTVDSNVESGQVLTFQANTLRAGENFLLNGAAETNGSLLTFGGFGTETLTGGQQSDGFYFGTGRFNAADRVIGGAGSDQLGLQGDFAGANALSLGQIQLTGVEFLVLMSASDTRFGGGSVGQNYSYTITTHDGNVATGQRMIVSANALGSSEVLIFNGSPELDGSFQIFSGAGVDTLIGGERADDIWGGAGADRIEGRGGADTLQGGAGNDLFIYRAVTDSTNAARDQLLDFTLGDRIDLSAVDGNGVVGGSQSFVFIGSSAFSGAAGQLRVTQAGTVATVEGDTNGDLVADFAISVTVTDSHTLTIADFVGVAPVAETLKLADDDAIGAAIWDSGQDPYLEMHMLLNQDFTIA